MSTATLVYDHQPILDAFRRVGPDVVMGAMDLRGMATPYLFELTRNPEGCR
ncbi:DUF4334 domain-containing protein [Arsenicicoccus sp. oral taxon 190]|uniref:DUF4334 domain-containing protein n=1 Tax=Arsenicicoccus sp. oral taxon 190 TaxID=1658671 RepID=UPI00209C8993|nr:DUF4334 domain-containing protein [Arsenicicoccus sp. oral taxon 190]